MDVNFVLTDLRVRIFSAPKLASLQRRVKVGSRVSWSFAERVLGPGRSDEWKGLVQILEREGFPKVEPRFGGRYWRAVEVYLQAKHNLISIAPGRFGKQDGGETCPQPAKKKSAPGLKWRAATVHVLPIGARDPT
jgi:hypothetical protein